MSIDANKTAARTSLRMWAAGTAIETTGLFADDYVNHQLPGPTSGDEAIGLSEWRALVAANHRAFPDLKVEILRQVAEGDTVATHWRFSGTQSGPYAGAEPTHKRTTWSGVQIDRFADGLIVESWVSWDKFTQLRDLGTIA